VQEDAQSQKAPRQYSSFTAEEVRRYLKKHPNFLNENADLLSVLTPPEFRKGDNVVDFQGFMVDRLRQDVARLDEFQGALLAASRSNLVTQQQVHEAVLAIMDATSLEHLVHTVSGDWVDMLGVDSVALCLESKAAAKNPGMSSGIVLITPGTVKHLIGEDDAILLREDVEALPQIFGPAAPLIRAEALVALSADVLGVPGILAFGSRDAESFAPGQGTELLRFLALTLERMLTQWLKVEI
jgi:uncharacterized protein YigA (DUF484 family)